MTNKSSGYVLVVDDVQFMRRQIIRILNGLGYDALDSGDGAHAIRTMQLDPPSLVLLDLNMPQVSGIEVCEWIRSNPGTKDVPVIICTAAQERKTLEKAIRAGANDVLIKPISKDSLRARMAKHLQPVS